MSKPNFHMRYEEPCPVCGKGTLVLHNLAASKTYTGQGPQDRAYALKWTHRCDTCYATLVRHGTARPSDKED